MKAKQVLTMSLVIGLLCGTTSRAASPCGVSTGDRVKLVVDNPDNPTLRYGMTGTVICFNTHGSIPWPVLVSFDNWLDGQETAWWCTTPPTSYVRGSLWPLACKEFSWIPPWPDLLDGGEPDRHFQPQMLIAGVANQILEIRFKVVNGGRGSPWNSTYVDLYASSDTKIAPSDYKLGSTAYFFISGTGELEKTQKVVFPTDIPPGFYYIGWIIDPTNLVSEETNETNNTAYLSSYKLVVSTPPGTPSLELSAARGGQITTPGEGVFPYPVPQTVSVEATPDPNGAFVAWVGTAVDAGKVADVNAASTQVTVGARYSLTALFEGANLVVEDFEGYSGTSPVNTLWVDGLAWLPGKPKGHRGNDTGATIGNAEAPTSANPTIHSGTQAMAFHYDNSRDPKYSEASRRWGILQNWTATGADKLSVWFRGEPGNTAQPLCVIIEDCYRKAAVLKHPDTNAVLAADWTQWTVPLEDIQAKGVMLSRIVKMYIVVGDRDKPVTGGAGTLYFDDFTLVHK